MKTSVRVPLLLALSIACRSAWSAAELDPVEVGKWPTYNGPIVDLAVEGQHAYCLLGGGTIGLQIFDVSDPVDPTPVGFYKLSDAGVVEQLVVQGGYAYVLDVGAGFEVIDVRDPANPVHAGAVWEAWGTGFAISGNHAYVGGYVIDISDPTNPELVGSSELLNGQVAARGDYVYAAAYNWMRDRVELKVIDVTDPASPQLLGSTDVGSGYLLVSGDLVFVSTLYGYISVVDVSDPRNPRLVSGIPAGGAKYMTLAGDFLYLHGNVLTVVDVGDPTDPRRSAVYPIDGYFVKSGDHGFGFRFGFDWYNPHENDGLHVLDLTGLDLANPPTNPEWVGHYQGGGDSTDHVAVSGDHAYTVGSLFPAGAFLEILDMSDPANPMRVGVFTNWPVIEGRYTWPQEVVGRGDRVYTPFTSGLDSGVHVLDVSDMSNPQLIDTFSTEGRLQGIAVGGGYIFLAYSRLGFTSDEGGLLVVDLNHPSGPREVARHAVPISFDVTDVGVSGDYAYLLGFRELLVLDVSDPTNPFEAGRLPDVGGMRLDIAGTYAGLLGVSSLGSPPSSALNILDLSNPTSPQLIGTRFLPEPGDEIALSGNRAFVRIQGKGVQVVDLTNPDGPQPLYLEGSDVAVYGSFALVTLGPAGLRVIDTGIPPLPAPETVGSYETFPGREFGPLFINGDHAFVVSDRTLHVLDTSDPLNPRRVGRYDSPAQLSGEWAVSGDIGCFSHPAEFPLRRVLEMIDLSDPTNPHLVGTYETEIEFERPYLHGDLVYLSYRAYPTPEAGFDVIDISDPVNPHQAGSYRTTGEVYDLHPAGSHVLLGVCCSPAGYELISVSDPTQPQFIKLLEIEPGQIRFIEEDKAYVKVDESIEVLDVTDPVNPQSLAHHSEFDISSLAGDLALGRYRNSNTEAGFGLIDTSDPNDWELVARFGPFGNWGWVYGALSGDHAVVAEEYAVRLFDLRPLANPQRVVRHDFENRDADPWAVFLDGGRAYVADRVQGLVVGDVTDPAQFQTVGGFGTPGTATDVAVSGDHAFIADWSGGLLVLDVSTPANPQFVASLPLPDADVNFPEVAERVVVVENHAYVTGYGFHVIDVSNPASPVRLGGYNPPDGALAVAVSGNYAYVVAHLLHVIDIGNPNDPQPVGLYEPSSGFFPPLIFNVAVAGNVAYLASEAGLLVVDVSDPANPQPIGTYPGAITTVVVDGNLVYATERSLGLLVLDVADPTQPRRVGGNTTVWQARDLELVDGSLYLLSSRELHLFSLFQPPNAIWLEPLTVQLPGTFRFLLHGPSGMSGRIQRGSNPQALSDWLPFSLGDNSLEIADPSASSNAIQFYRAVSP